MTDKITRVCDYCGKGDILNDHIDSNGMVIASGVEKISGGLLLMIDIPEEYSCRPFFLLGETAWHPECLIKALQKWLKHPWKDRVKRR